jgi:hypothetical protein
LARNEPSSPRWDIYLVRSTPAELLGTVEAPNADAAIEAAVRAQRQLRGREAVDCHIEITAPPASALVATGFLVRLPAVSVRQDAPVPVGAALVDTRLPPGRKSPRGDGGSAAGENPKNMSKAALPSPRTRPRTRSGRLCRESAGLSHYGRKETELQL